MCLYPELYPMILKRAYVVINVGIFVQQEITNGLLKLKRMPF